MAASRVLQNGAEAFRLPALAALSQRGVPAAALVAVCACAAALLLVSNRFASLATAAVLATLVPYVAICVAAGNNFVPSRSIPLRLEQRQAPSVVENDPTVRSGAISMAHAFGGSPDEAHRVRELGSNTGALIPVDRDYDPISGIPRMSAIPVNVRKIAGM